MEGALRAVALRAGKHVLTSAEAARPDPPQPAMPAGRGSPDAASPVAAEIDLTGSEPKPKRKPGAARSKPKRLKRQRCMTDFFHDRRSAAHGAAGDSDGGEGDAVCSADVQSVAAATAGRRGASASADPVDAGPRLRRATRNSSGHEYEKKVEQQEAGGTVFVELDSDDGGYNHEGDGLQPSETAAPQRAQRSADGAGGGACGGDAAAAAALAMADEEASAAATSAAVAAAVAEEYRDAWDNRHVRLPCSEQNVLRGEGEGEPKWGLIQKLLRTPIADAEELTTVIMRINPSFSWNLRGLSDFFARVSGQPAPRKRPSTPPCTRGGADRGVILRPRGAPACTRARVRACGHACRSCRSKSARDSLAARCPSCASSRWSSLLCARKACHCCALGATPRSSSAAARLGAHMRNRDIVSA